MGYGTLNIWIRDEKCKLIDEDGIVIVKTCAGIPFKWCDQDFGEIPFHCGHVSIRIPPGCYIIQAKVRNTDSEEQKHKSYSTDRVFVIISCGDDACVNLIKSDQEDKCHIYFLDTFSTEVLSAGYTWFDQDKPDAHSLTSGWLGICANKGQDLWGGLPIKRGAPLMLRTAPNENYWAETFVVACDEDSCDDNNSWVKSAARCLQKPSQAINTQVGLFVFQDVSNWMFFGLTNHDFSGSVGDGLIVTKTSSDVNSIVAQNTLTEDFAFLKVEKYGNNWGFYWKLYHDDAWSLLTTTDLILSDHQIGMGVKTLDLEQQFGPAQAYFDYFLIGQCPQVTL